MTPLNLSRNPPRSPSATLDGLIFLPRSIDKVRATLPGGDSGPYVIAGLTQTMLDMLGIALDVFTLAVSAAIDDAEIARFLRLHAPRSKYDAWNAFVTAREPRGGNRAEAIEVYPWLEDRPDVILVLDVLAEDDRRYFASSAGESPTDS